MLAIPVENSTYDQLVEGLEQLTALHNSTDAHRCAFVAEFAERVGNLPEAIAGVAAVFQISNPKAREWVETAAALRSLPATAAAFAAGRIGFDKVASLVKVATPETEEELIERAPSLSVAELRRFAREMTKRETLDPRELHRTRRLSYGWNADHTVLSFTGDLTLELGDAFVNAIEREMDAQLVPGDRSRESYATRAADALSAIVSNKIAEDADPDRATVVVHTDLSLLTRGEGLADTEDGTPLDRATALRLACDCRIQMAVHGGDGAVVEVSTTTYSAPRWMRRQLKKRDRCCQFPGCRNTRFLHAHHIVRWTPEAPDTSLSNLVLLCPLHHGWVHYRGWQPGLDPVTGIVSWLRPDGSVHDPAPPLREDLRERLFGGLELQAV